MMSKPVRVQRRRTEGWRMPENTVYVGRPTKWGNKYKVGSTWTIFGGDGDGEVFIKTASRAVEMYRWNLIDRLRYYPKEQVRVIEDIKRELRGKNLACWCPLDQPCHADILLELANK